MSRPLIVTDCDEVLLHMIAPFREWLAEAHGVEFDLSNPDFGQGIRFAASGEVVPREQVWDLLNRFFDTEMGRQHPIAGAVEAINALTELADVVVLTNLADHRREHRTQQLVDHGIAAKVYTNLGPKGPALKAILDEYRPGSVFFIDDIAQHHESASQMAPHVTRIQMVGEPLVAPHVPCGLKLGHAHARIDSWAEALPWLWERLQKDAT